MYRPKRQFKDILIGIENLKYVMKIIHELFRTNECTKHYLIGRFAYLKISKPNFDFDVDRDEVLTSNNDMLKNEIGDDLAIGVGILECLNIRKYSDSN